MEPSARRQILIESWVSNSLYVVQTLANLYYLFNYVLKLEQRSFHVLMFTLLLASSSFAFLYYSMAIAVMNRYDDLSQE